MESKPNKDRIATFTGSPDDFVELIRFIEDAGYFVNADTGEPATREEIAAKMLNHMEVDLGGYPDYKTLELCSNGSDLREKLLAVLKRLREGDTDLSTDEL